MYDEESIDERNSMKKPYLYYSQEYVQDPITAQEMKQACKEREKLQNVHRNDCLIDLWAEY